MSAKLRWRTPTVEQVRLPDIDHQRWLVEFQALQECTRGVGEDDLLEAVRRMVVDQLDVGHTPSLHRLRMISGELKEAWLPDRKRRQHSKEVAFLCAVQDLKEFWAAEKYGNAPGAKTKAEADAAEAFKLSVDALDKRRTRFRKRLKAREAELERQRKRPLRK